MTPWDPTAPLPGPPDPWAASEQPSPRSGPPFHMTEMIEAEPHLARRLLGRCASSGSAAVGLADAVGDAVAADRAVVVTGCGTSEHAALGTAEILAEAVGPQARVTAEQAFELSLDPPRDALVIGISHEGGTRATVQALVAARAAGSRTALVTAAAGSPAAAHADVVVATDELDQSWCHTVGYLSPLVVAAGVGGHLTGRMPDPDAVFRLVAAGAADADGADRAAERLAARGNLLVIASGADRVAGRELVLKVEEAAWLPSAYRDLETFLHGHLPAAGDATGLVLLLSDRRARDSRIHRARQALRAAAAVGTLAAAIVSSEASQALEADLTPGGRLIVPDAAELPPSVAALLGTATALQILTERIARARGTNPDPIRRDDPRYHAASEVAERDP